MRKKSLIGLISNILPQKGKALALLSVSVCSLFFASCTNDPFNGSSFDCDVTNTTLMSPGVDDISVTASADGSQTKITWPVVFGASGYQCSVYDVTNPDEPLVVDGIENKIIDGCSLVASRYEEANYKFVIKTIGNVDLNNKDAETATEVSFNSFTSTFGSIPAGDIAEWFKKNPIPEDKVEEVLCYDLEPGGEYTLNESLDFSNHLVTLRTTSKVNHAKITINGESSFVTARGLNLKYIDFDCANETNPLIQLSKTPDDAIKDLVGTKGAYFIQDPIALRSCNINDLGTCLITSNKLYYVVRNFIVDDCVVKLNKTTNGDAIINFNGAGYATSYLINKSTIYDIGNKNEYFFSQYGGRPQDIVSNGSEKQSMAIRNSTLYNVSHNKKFSNQRAKGQKFNEYIVTNSIIVDCGTNQFIPGLVEQKSKDVITEYVNNTYYYGGEEVSANNTGDGCDNSGTAIKDNPGFANPTAGDFTVSGAGQISKKTGDPRWLP